MAKKKKEHTEWIITKGQRSRWQKEQQRRRQLVIAVSVVIAIVLILIIIAVYDSTASPYDKTALKVTGPLGERTYHMDNYVDMLRLYGIRQATSEDDLTSIATNTLNAMGTNEISRQLAEELNITITEDDIDGRIRKFILAPIAPGTGTEEPSPPSYEEAYEILLSDLGEIGVSEEDYRQIIASEIARERLQEQIGKDKVPEAMAQVHVQGILVDTSAPIVLAGTPPEVTSSSGTPAGNEIDQPTDAEELYEIIKTKLEAGEDFSILAQQYSKYLVASDSGGDLGWIPREIASIYYGASFEAAVFTLELNTLSELIPLSVSEDNTRYWILQVIGKEDDRPLDTSHKEQLETIAFNDWYTQQSSRFIVKNDYLDATDLAWAIDKAL